MGWANCGTDSEGRPIGYAAAGQCDHDGCNTEIDRGLAHACGGMHGDCGGQACEKYFCGEHLHLVDQNAVGLHEIHDGQMCAACVERAKTDLWEALQEGDLSLTTISETQS